jgi:hypothetical protein
MPFDSTFPPPVAAEQPKQHRLGSESALHTPKRRERVLFALIAMRRPNTALDMVERERDEINFSARNNQQHTLACAANKAGLTELANALGKAQRAQQENTLSPEKARLLQMQRYGERRANPRITSG